MIVADRQIFMETHHNPGRRARPLDHRKHLYTEMGVMMRVHNVRSQLPHQFGECCGKLRIRIGELEVIERNRRRIQIVVGSKRLRQRRTQPRPAAGERAAQKPRTPAIGLDLAEQALRRDLRTAMRQARMRMGHDQNAGRAHRERPKLHGPRSGLAAMRHAATSNPVCIQCQRFWKRHALYSVRLRRHGIACVPWDCRSRW